MCCPRQPACRTMRALYGYPSQTPTRRALANAIRALSMDAVQAANSGHPGAPMGMADIAEVLWRDVLKHTRQPQMVEPRPLRALERPRLDAAVFAAALSGYPLQLDELKKFRQLGAHRGTPGTSISRSASKRRPAAREGLRQRGGMALAEKLLAAQYNHDGAAIVDHHTYCFVGDGCLMEGIRTKGVVRRAPEARQAHRVLRRQRNFHRRQDRRLVQRRHAEALRSVRLARGEERRRPRCRRGRRRHQEGEEPQGSAFDHLLQDHHRLGRS